MHWNGSYVKVIFTECEIIVWKPWKIHIRISGCWWSWG